MRRLKLLLFSGIFLCAIGAQATIVVNPDGSINVGSVSLFTVLTSGDLDDTNNTLTGPSHIIGNVGVGGNGDFSMSNGVIDGDVYMNSHGKFKKSGPAQHNGNLFLNQDPTLNTALNDARMLSDMAAMETSTGSYVVTMGTFNGTTVNGNQNVTLNGTGKIVLNLQDFVMSGGTFTLSGTAMTTYIINVSKKFSLNNSQIVLSGGLMASHVLFNVRGTGEQVSLNQGTSMQGILLAVKRKVALSGGKVYGKVIAEQLALTGGGQVISQ